MHGMVEQKPGGLAGCAARGLLGERERTSREPHSRTVAFISRRHALAALAQEMKLALTELYEVAEHAREYASNGSSA